MFERFWGKGESEAVKQNADSDKLKLQEIERLRAANDAASQERLRLVQAQQSPEGVVKSAEAQQMAIAQMAEAEPVVGPQLVDHVDQAPESTGEDQNTSVA